MFGPRPNRIILELEKETQKYHEAHSMASESNLTLNKAMRLHVKNLRLLSLTPDQLETEIPTLAGPYKQSISYKGRLIIVLWRTENPGDVPGEICQHA